MCGDLRGLHTEVKQNGVSLLELVKSTHTKAQTHTSHHVVLKSNSVTLCQYAFTHHYSITPRNVADQCGTGSRDIVKTETQLFKNNCQAKRDTL